MRSTLANLLGLLPIAAFLLLIRWAERLPVTPPEDYARHEGRVIAFVVMACLVLAGIGATLGLPK